MSLVPAVANRLFMAGALPARRRFERAARDPAAAQRAILARILRANAGTAFGARHGFTEIRSPGEYRERVPAFGWEQLEADLLRTGEGHAGTRTAHPLLCFEPTGGSTGGNKLVPITRPLLREFSAATLPWVYDLLRHRPALRSGRAYWALTPPARQPEATPAGVPIGMPHDSDYFPALAGALLERVLGTPRALALAPDVDAWRYLTLRALLALDDLAFVSVWSPSFLTLLASGLDEHFERLLADMERGTLGVRLAPGLRARFERAVPARPRRARALRRRFGARAPRDLGGVWPRLALISCWSDAQAARALPALRERFPGVEIQGKGLLATEGVVSFPLFEAGGPVAAVASHFLELLPEGETDAGRAVGMEAAADGATYEVLLTTSGGLYRYRLRDLVRVEGRYHGAPVLSFQGRADHTSDLAGEKLIPSFVERALTEAVAATGVRAPFATLTPAHGTPPHYDLRVECDPADAARLAHALEERLASSVHYGLCRRLGQLGAVRPIVVADAERRYERACIDRGQRISAIKPPSALGAGMGGA